ncbi:amidohydrolase 2 [Patellaria atrata CBS 101060]|uniref:Amidohydrolase 2 n=1 Tax=Patellaria atrata CBS 101060 TaxID=1346257 RepID=A0A9P4S959_9PEZI|nr:amidohydrolase 2 [Patellaria atrata CBS 101060]
MDKKSHHFIVFAARNRFKHSSRSKCCPSFPVSYHLQKLHTTRSVSQESQKNHNLSIPKDAWDCHIHVTDTKKFPINVHASYQPHDALLPDALKNAERLNLPNVVLVQPSTYTTWNNCLLAALKGLGTHRARGIVSLSLPKLYTSTRKEVEDSSLKRWHKLGVRGLRINLKSDEFWKRDLFQNILYSHDLAIRRMENWCLDLYVGLDMLPALEEIVDRFRAKIVLAHFAGLPKLPENAKERQKILKGDHWACLLRLLERQKVFVKVSAPYRITDNQEHLEPYFKSLIAVRGGEAVVFASDWPHTRFEDKVDAKEWLDISLKWCEDNQQLVEKLFKTNAERLYDATTTYAN